MSLINLVGILLLSLCPLKLVASGLACEKLFYGEGEYPFPKMADVKTKDELTASSNLQIEYSRTGPYIIKQTDRLSTRVALVTYNYDTHTVEIMRSFHDVNGGSDRVSAMNSHGRDHLAAINMKPKTRSTRINPKGQKEIARKIFENLSFVLKVYKEEKLWPNEFLRQLVTVAFQYAEYSTYINVRSKEGKIIGSVRIIQTPHVNKERAYSRKDRWDNSALFSELKVKASELPDPELWREIYGSEDIHLTGLKPSLGELKDGVALVPAPFESILGRRYIEERDNGPGLSSIVEPGNFAILKNRNLPKELQNVAAQTLYYHLARLVRPEAGQRSKPTLIGTYASVGSTSDRFYQSLGFKIRETIPPLSPRNPTNEPWNVLIADGEGLTTALRLRLRLSAEYSNGSIEQNYFWKFDEFEMLPPSER